MILIESVSGAYARALVAGWPWALTGFAALIAVPRNKLSLGTAGGVAGIGLAWICLFFLTGDRRLFFPYTVQFAVQEICLLHGRVSRSALVGAVSSMSLFTAVRLIQGVTLPVLLVEWVVAAAVLAVITVVWRRSPQTTSARLGLALAGSLLACAGLSL